MKTALLTLVLLSVVGAALGAGLIAPVPVPQELVPTKFCHPSHAAEEDGMIWCNRGPNQSSCLAKGGYSSCKDGEKMEETNICSSYCHREFCYCCRILRGQDKKKGK